jgi:ferredoxin-NADP reductase
MESDSPARPVGRADELNLIVQRLNREADGVLSVILADPAGRDLFPWDPGAHVDVLLPGMTRHYSLCGDPSDRRHYRIGVLLESKSRGGSRYIHNVLEAGDQVTVRRPRNNFPLTDDPEYLFIGGGIGITPLLPMIAQVESRGRPWRLVYGGRLRGSMAFLDELAQYGDKVMVRPQDEYGLLDLATLLADPAQTSVYCCGPEPLLAAVEAQCETWPSGRLHVERFAALASDDIESQTPFEVECKESGITVTVPAGQTMLDALIAAGIDMNFDCREGTCGTCEVDLVEGMGDHRDAIQSAAERKADDIIFPCVSRARSPKLIIAV